ncbi:MFS transporter, partial [Cellulomonas bogoriensis 69B4 = DSM 16987]
RGSTGRRRGPQDPAPPGPWAGVLLRSPLAWGLAVAFGMNSMNTYVLFAWLPSLLTDVGLDPGDAARRLALFAALGLPSALVVPVLAERVRRPFVIVALFCGCLVGGYVGLLVAPTTALWVWVVLLGVGPGTFPLLLTLVNLRTRTPAASTALSGFVQGAGYALAAPGPVLVGLLHVGTGGWTAVLVVLVVSVGVLLGAGWFACRPVMLEDAPRPGTGRTPGTGRARGGTGRARGGCRAGDRYPGPRDSR